MSRLLTPDGLWDIPRVGSPATDASGNTIVVPVTTFDHDPAGITRLWLLTDPEPVPLTAASSSATDPALSADGTQLAFVRAVDGVKQIHVMRLDGGEAEPVTNFPLGAMGPRWFPDGRAVACLGTVYRTALTLEAARARKEELVRRPYAAHVTEGRFYRHWDSWLTDEEVPHLFRINLADRAVIDLTPSSTVYWKFANTGHPEAQYDIAPDGHEVAYSAFRTDDPDTQPTAVIRVVDVAGGVPRIVSAGGPGNALRPRYSADGRFLVYGRQFRDDFYADRPRLIRHDRTTGTELMMLADWDRAPSDWELGRDGTIVFIAEDEGFTKIFRLADHEAAEPMSLTTHGTAGAVSPGTRRTIFVHHSLGAPPEVFELGNAGPRQLTHFTAAATLDLNFGRVDSITFTGAAGDQIQMFTIEPPVAGEGPPHPLVHLIHGGPHSSFGDAWHWRWNAQVVAGAGYRVAMVNFHGSTGWGQAFAESILGEWGDKPYHDVEAATDLLVERGLVDPGRMAVTGGSYGGYLTTWIISQTNRYRCAIAHAGVSNLSGMYASDLTFHRRTAFGAEYWEDPGLVDRYSPSAHAAGYSTPTLVTHGELDYRVPVTQGLELFGVLKAKGIEARLVHYPTENHWITKRPNSIHWYGEFLDWLGRHLGPDPQ